MAYLPRTRGPGSPWPGNSWGKETAALEASNRRNAVGRESATDQAACDGRETAGGLPESRVQPGGRLEGNSGAKHWSGAQRRGWAVAQSRSDATEGGAEDAIEVGSAIGEARARKGPGGTEASRHFSAAKRIAALAAN